MHCSMSMTYAFMLMPDLNEVDVRFGQLVVLAAALSVVLLGNLVAILLATGAA